MDIVTVAIPGILVFLIVYLNKENLQKFIISSDSSVNIFREKDYDFYLMAKYGENVNPNKLFKRITIRNYRK